QQGTSVMRLVFEGNRLGVLPARPSQPRLDPPGAPRDHRRFFLGMCCYRRRRVRRASARVNQRTTSTFRTSCESRASGTGGDGGFVSWHSADEEQRQQRGRETEKAPST